MTSREGIREAINHKEPDMVPVDPGASPGSGISAVSYFYLTNNTGKNDLPVLIYNIVQQLDQPEMIEAGIEIFTTVQTNTLKMDSTFPTIGEKYFRISHPGGTGKGVV